MKQKIKLSIIALAIVLLAIFPNKSMAATNCTTLSDDKIKYVNATLTDIDIEAYNAMQRGIDPDTYYNKLSTEEKYALDLKSMLMDSTDCKCIGGVQNGYKGCLQYGDYAGAL